MTGNNVALENIAVDQLRPHPKNPRLIMRQDVIDGIKAAIQERGEFSPKYALLARQVADHYEIISGHHRLEAARLAGCETIPCWIEDMDDARAEMELVLANNQGELTPLEYGLHALHCVPDNSKGGRGKKEGLREYARVLSRDVMQLSVWKKAADVYETVLKETVEKNLQFNPIHFIDKHSHLAAIHAAPADCWPALCQYLLDGKDITVSKVQGKAKELAELKKEIPEWWPVDLAKLADSLIADQQYAQRMLLLFQFAGKQDQNLKKVTLYRHQRTEEREERNGREYFKLEPEAYEYDALAEFKSQVLACDTLPKVDRLREIVTSIDLHIGLNSENSVRWLPVLTDAEQAEHEERRMTEQRHHAQRMAVESLYANSCITGLRGYSGAKIDLLLTDPPYGMAFQSNRRIKRDKESSGIQNDESIEQALGVFEKMMDAAGPHLAENAHVIVFCCDEYEPEFRALLARKELTFKRLLVWVKPNHGSGDLQGSFAPRKELALHFVKGSPSVYPRIDDVFIQDHGESVSDHPTEKPASLLEAWIGSTTQPGDLVLDPFMGTGAALVSAKRLDRKYIGFEIDDHYHRQAVERVLAEVK